MVNSPFESAAYINSIDYAEKTQGAKKTEYEEFDD